jgi:hypothetical protein
MSSEEEPIVLHHEGLRVGQMSQITSDMWYIEGDWHPQEGGEGFAELLTQQDLKANFRNGTGVNVEWSQGSSTRHAGLVMGMVDERLMFRMLTGK